MHRALTTNSKRRPRRDPRKLSSLRAEYRKLAAELARVDAAIARLGASSGRRLSVEAFERWTDELSEGFAEDAPPLPPDFSRADLYTDHD